MNWKENKAVGAVAAVLVVIGAAGIVPFARSQPVGEAPMHYFLCESTGQHFAVRAVAGDEEYEKFYIVEAGQATKCKLCERDDAYPAMLENGEWVKIPHETPDTEPEAPPGIQTAPDPAPEQEQPGDWDSIKASERAREAQAASEGAEEAEPAGGETEGGR